MSKSSNQNNKSLGAEEDGELGDTISVQNLIYRFSFFS